MDLIPGLPNDIALDCLIRVPYNHFSSAASVCRSWKYEIELPSFRHHRKYAGLSRRIAVMVQSPADSNWKHGLRKYSAAPAYSLTVYEPETGNWSKLPPVPGFSDGLPLFCQIVPVGFNLVVMGGLNPENWDASRFLYVYSFVSAMWRRGLDMPGCRRSFFGCASDNDRRIFVAGGHDTEKNALRSGMMYDVAEDNWTVLPDMADERDECKDGAVVALDHSSRTRIPSDMNSVSCVIECGGQLLAVGSDGFGGSRGVYVLDVERSTWVKAEMPEEYSGHIQSGCCLEV
ncbi:hypothetical protein L1987_47605 [Smallanthus sonchifolius]|uniref:Uncharacterized protein n=1 Tax=Smallanthus sonchifolius TaxID=185202 RepID=A0ACB9G333_9ASTR|nr:hypothetical protein L1987_47605 [Smallanthus sonchifolius]